MLVFEMFPAALGSSLRLCVRTLGSARGSSGDLRSLGAVPSRKKNAVDWMIFDPKKLCVGKTAPTNSLKLLEGDPALLQQPAARRAVGVLSCWCRVLLHPLAPSTIISVA